MTIGLWQLITYAFYVVLVIAAVSAIMGFFISAMIALLTEKSECTGDCDQGRRCTCDKGEANDKRASTTNDQAAVGTGIVGVQHKDTTAGLSAR